MDLIPDPGALVYLTIFGGFALGLFILMTKAVAEGESDPIERDFDPRPSVDPETEARRRAF